MGTFLPCGMFFALTCFIPMCLPLLHFTGTDTLGARKCRCSKAAQCPATPLLFKATHNYHWFGSVTSLLHSLTSWQVFFPEATFQRLLCPHRDQNVMVLRSFEDYAMFIKRPLDKYYFVLYTVLKNLLLLLVSTTSHSLENEHVYKHPKVSLHLTARAKVVILQTYMFFSVFFARELCSPGNRWWLLTYSTLEIINWEEGWK